ncbi:podocan-like protein 1 [Chiloscyllium plagiosum]|uniref:podocan-like protein 1 n=1 Tax=Chiloscyllium plagiosum TaxID=36176 RepID=UPI001CB7C676|nr:podocan-like protein 1 [Chiloscyllium plagiosum]
MKNNKGMGFSWMLMWAALLLQGSAVDSQNTTESRQIEVQIARTILMSAQTQEYVDRLQGTKGTNLQTPGKPTLAATLRVNGYLADRLSNETTASTGNSLSPEAPMLKSLTPMSNWSGPGNATISTFLLHNISVTLRPLPAKDIANQAPSKTEANLIQKLAVHNSLVPIRQLTVNHTVSLALNSSQYSAADIRMPQMKISTPQAVRKKESSSFKRGLSRNQTIPAHQRLVRGRNATGVREKLPKLKKVIKPTKQSRKPQKQRSSKQSTKKLKARVKLDRLTKHLKVKKGKSSKTGKSKVKQTPFPYFEDYYCPPQCSCYGRIVQCSDKGLNKIPYGIPFNTRNLLLMNNKIDLIPLGLLDEYMLLEFLVLNNNKLTDIGVEGALEGIQKLTRLYMDQNNLSTVPKDLPMSLEELTLNSNNISVMPSNVWANCKNLRIISFNDNRIRNESIPPGTFKPLQNLHTIKMNHNLLTAIPTNLSTSLRQLYLEGNQIRKIPDSVFTNSSALIYLDLHDNRLNNKGITEKAFQYMTQLEYLDLSKNSLTAIPKLLPRSLKKLILHANGITAIRRDAFTNMVNLEEIYLAHNQISLVAAGTFWDLPGLRCLDLSHNRLHQVPRQLPLTLQNLYLHSNRIVAIPGDSVCGHHWERSHLILVRLEKNNLDQRQLDARALRCLRGYQVIHLD